MKNRIFSKTVVFSCVFAALSFFLFSYEMKQFEKGILDVVASSQDGYVRLVTDQISLKENREDEEIVNNILSTLDASNNRYWTFSKGDTLIFVKDVMETEKYKKFTASTYYQSISSQQFYDELKQNKVVHEVIEINNHNYIASGTVFSYNGTDYKLALLSNEDAILENNTYLKGKIESCIAYYGTVLVLLLVSCLIAWQYDRIKSAQLNDKNEIKDLNQKVVALNRQLFKEESQKTRIWNINELPSFVSAFADKGIEEGMTAEVVFHDADSKAEFMKEQLDLLPEDMICFDRDDRSLVLLVIYETEEEMQSFLHSDHIQNVIYKVWHFTNRRY